MASRNSIRTASAGIGAGAALAFAVSRIGALYYDLNDDSLMAEILAGSYTGTPAVRNIQSGYPLTLLLGGLYRLLPQMDWYAAFLLLVQYGALVCVWLRICRQEKRRGRRTALLLLSLLAAGALLLYHYVFLQYSVTVGILGAASAFLFLTMKELRLREILPPVLLIFLGYLLRSEMMLFVGPFCGLAFFISLCRLTLGREPGKAAAGSFWKWFVTVGLLVGLGLLACEAGNRFGYRSGEWKTFLTLFDARTQLYDFEYVPDYAGNEDFYQSIGLSGEQVTLLQNYNYGLDDSIDAETLQAVADYAASVRSREMSTKERLRDAVWNYRRSLTGQAELRSYGESLSSQPEKPYRGIVCSLYLLAFAAGLWKIYCAARRGSGRKRALFLLAEPAALFVIRSGLLLYLYYNKRPVARLTHSVYLCESVILLWLLLRDQDSSYSENPGGIPDRERTAACGPAAAAGGAGDRKGTSGSRLAAVRHAVLPAALSVLMLWGIACQWKVTAAEESKRAANNEAYVQLQDYAEDHAENVYLLDVYSTVSFSDPIGDAGRVPVNLELLGGWACKSPLEREKLQRLGLDTKTSYPSGTGLFDALLLNSSVYVAAETGADMTWLENFYASRGVQVQVTCEDVIGESWEIYAVQRS